MTADVVARLRSRSPYLHGSSAERAMDEAAAEIKRLRTERAYIAETLYGELRAEIEQLRAPITMQDIRLCAGEGKLSAATVLQATNAVLRMRSSLRPKP